MRECQYCGEKLVRLKTVARCYEVVRLEQDHVVWKDENGVRHRHGILTKDHIVPRCKGGTNDCDNIAYSCGPCNVKKDAKVGVKLDTGEVVIVDESVSLCDPYAVSVLVEGGELVQVALLQGEHLVA